MKFILDKNRAISTQIFEQVCLMILKDKLPPDYKLLSVREFALEVGVNPNTIQKTYDLLEEAKVIYSIKGSGWYVSNNIDIVDDIVNKMIVKKVESLVEELKTFDVSRKQLIDYLKKGCDCND